MTEDGHPSRGNIPVRWSMRRRHPHREPRSQDEGPASPQASGGGPGRLAGLVPDDACKTRPPANTGGRHAGPIPLGLLEAGLATLCALQFLTWAPHYITRPLWADHDVFATMAQGWDAGLLPYRDLASNNVPGTIYLFWALGKLAGWGRPTAFYVADVTLLLLLGGTLLTWSARLFGRVLPGLAGFAAVQSYYLGLDFSQAAQRDWHGPLLAILGVLVAQAWPGRGGRSASAALLAVALAIRPQAALLLPAAVAAVVRGPGRAVATRAATARAVVEWGLVLAVAAVLAFTPLAWAGVLGDFVRGIRLVAPGGHYYTADLGSFAAALVRQLMDPRIVGVPLAIVLLAARSGAAAGVAGVWLIALAGALLYLPVSPAPRSYLVHPLWYVWSVDVAVLTQACLELRGRVPALRWVAVASVLGVGTTLQPRYCTASGSLRAMHALWRGGEPEHAPPGYSHPFVPVYPWEDYRALLGYIRGATAPGTRVANLLKGVAVTGPTARLPALPAESVTWLFMVDPGDEGRFARFLERASDSVVVWAPGEDGADSPDRFAELARAVRLRYQPEARFGAIEVWRRVPGVEGGRHSYGPSPPRTQRVGSRPASPNRRHVGEGKGRPDSRTR